MNLKKLYILANGAMAQALAKGLKDEYKLTIIGRNKEKLKALKEELALPTLLYDEFNAENKDLILAFKPYALNEVALKLKGKARLLISVLANTPLQSLSCIQAQNHIRIMPNIAAAYKASTTPFICENELFKKELMCILQSFGQAFELEKEEHFNAAMALSGCAPAFLALIAEALANGGVYEGLNNALSYKLTASLFQSFEKLIQHEHPALIKEAICSPAGVSIKGIRVLEENKLRASLIKALHVSAQNKYE